MVVKKKWCFFFEWWWFCCWLELCKIELLPRFELKFQGSILITGDFDICYLLFPGSQFPLKQTAPKWVYVLVVVVGFIGLLLKWLLVGHFSRFGMLQMLKYYGLFLGLIWSCSILLAVEWLSVRSKFEFPVVSTVFIWRV